MLQEQDLGTPLTNKQSILQTRLELARNISRELCIVWVLGLHNPVLDPRPVPNMQHKLPV